MKEYLITTLIGYALGCFNIAYIISKAKGFDIRDTGTGNAGASNMKIALGWKYGVITGLSDILKSFLAVVICRRLFPGNRIIEFLAGGMAIIGHIFPFYLKFRGGKGFASYLGMVLAINWKLCLFVMLMTAIITWFTNYIVLGTFFTITFTLLYHIYMKESIWVILILFVLAALIFWKHRANIVRMIHHEEIGLRKK